MDQPLKWLKDATGAAWNPLAEALRSGLPVPDGFLVSPGVPEQDIRAAYEELKIREKTHFVAVRGPSHAMLDVVGPDRLIHAARRLWSETANADLLVERMVNAAWCGTADWESGSQRRILRVTANEGMRVFDPDIYIFNTDSGAVNTTLHPAQRKLIRRIDGLPKTIEAQGERTPLTVEHLNAVADLARRTKAEITWAIDDNGRLWLISVRNPD